MTSATFILMREGTPPATDAVPWVRLRDGLVTASGDSAAWRDADNAGADEPLILIAPAQVAPVTWLSLPGLTDAQARAAACHDIAKAALGDSADMHCAAGPRDVVTGATPATRVEAAWLTAWLDWAATHGASPAAVVPLAALIDGSRDNSTAARSIVIGSMSAVRVGNRGFANEPALVAAMIGDAAVAAMDESAIDAALARAAHLPPIDLLSGAFRRSASVLTAESKRWLIGLALALLLLSLLIPVVNMVRWSLATNSADSESVALAARAGVSAADAAGAETALDQKLAARGGGPLAFSVPASALLDAIQPIAGVAVQAMAHRADGTLSVTLAAPRVEDINAVLKSLQDKGYRVTAQPMTGADGLQKGSITIRAVP